MLKIIRTFVAGSELAGAFRRDQDAFVIKSRIANACTPDELIAAYIVRSFVNDFDSWAEEASRTLVEKGKVRCSRETRVLSWKAAGEACNYLSNKDKDLKLETALEKAAVDGDGHDPYYYAATGAVSVNGVLLEEASSRFIVTSWNRLKAKHAEALTVAEKAKADMAASEKKWNLAESLLGMKRNEHGTLVPVVNTEGEETKVAIRKISEDIYTYQDLGD